MRLAVIGLLLHGVALAQPPCDRCVLEIPAKHDDPVPIVVVLHGDRESATSAAAPWHAAVASRGWVLLSLQCPTDQGCKDSWWKWDGEPSWVRDQLAKVEKQVAIDPARRYLVGWSGGASWMGWRAQDWIGTFAAIVIHGGGIAPRAEACPSDALPAYFLVGDRNPLHGHARELREWFDGCHQAIVWDLVKGGDHDKEERALDKKKATAILEWLFHAHDK